MDDHHTNELLINQASLVVVGCGIKFMSHLTTEAKAYIQQSNQVLYLVNEPVMKDWIKQANPNTYSLEDLYYRYQSRHESYKAITEYILNSLEKNHHICVVMYGHPAVFAKPARDAVMQARAKGYYAKMLPAVSAQDCLFADLVIDPASCGCLSFDATDFLIYKRLFHNSSHLILWQISVIGVMVHSSSVNRAGIAVLVDYLKTQYTMDHEVVLYEAAQYPHLDPRISPIKLSELVAAELAPITTLYIPPVKNAIHDTEMLQRLGMIQNQPQ